MSSSSPWLPEEPLFLEVAQTPEVRPHRPWNQGDIFAEVPLAITAGTKANPQAPLRTACVMLMGNPCSLRGGASLAALQNVAEVRPLKEKEAGFEAPWEGRWQLFPLLGFDDDQLWVVDFNVMCTVGVKQLTHRRVASLSEHGWGALQKRYSNHVFRTHASIEEHMADSRRYWLELSIWEEWCVRGHRESEFPSWFREAMTNGPYAGTPRVDVIEMGPDFITAELPPAPPPAGA